MSIGKSGGEGSHWDSWSCVLCLDIWRQDWMTWRSWLKFKVKVMWVVDTVLRHLAVHGFSCFASAGLTVHVCLGKLNPQLRLVTCERVCMTCSKSLMAESWKGFLLALGTHLDELDLRWLRFTSEWIRDEFKSYVEFKLLQFVKYYNICF